MKKITEQSAQAMAKWSFRLLMISCIGILIALMCTSCGTTKISASITQPKDGSKTTITINTNTPISTDVAPTTELIVKPN